MSEEIKQGVLSHVTEVIETSPQIQMAIATGTTWMGIDLAFVQYLSPYFAFIGIVLGSILTFITIIKSVISGIREHREYKYRVRDRKK